MKKFIIVNFLKIYILFLENYINLKYYFVNYRDYFINCFFKIQNSKIYYITEYDLEEDNKQRTIYRWYDLLNLLNNYYHPIYDNCLYEIYYFDGTLLINNKQINFENDEKSSGEDTSEDDNFEKIKSENSSEYKSDENSEDISDDTSEYKSDGNSDNSSRIENDEYKLECIILKSKKIIRNLKSKNLTFDNVITIDDKNVTKIFNYLSESFKMYKIKVKDFCKYLEYKKVFKRINEKKLSIINLESFDELTFKDNDIIKINNF